MPVVRISIRKDLKRETKLAISDAVHRALVEEFKIPDADFWHIIDEVEPGNIIFPKEYLGVQHSENLTIVNICAAAGRTPEIKRNLFKAIHRYATANQTEVPGNDICVFLQENNGLTDYSWGNGEVQLPPHLLAKLKEMEAAK